MENTTEGSRMTDHPNLYNKALTIIKHKGYKLFLWPSPEADTSLGTFIASKDNRDFFADDPLRLLGMITIWEEHGDDWYVAPKYPSEKIKKALMDEAYPDSVANYEAFDEERFESFVRNCQYFFKKDYMPDIDIADNISKEELFNTITRLKTYEGE